MSRVNQLLLNTILAAAALSAQENSAPQQPIAFSHKQHVGLGVKCLDCHTMRAPGFEAGIPQEATCMGCHTTVKTDNPAIRKLAEFYETKRPVPWVKVYEVPDFVYFSHTVHYREAHIECESCHGPVAEREVIAKEKPTSMISCIACHEKSKATRECGTCHDIH
jgi:hypothetical protein